MNVGIVLLIAGPSWALKVPPSDLANERSSFSTGTDRASTALPKLVNVMEVPDVVEALRSAQADSQADAPELEAWRKAQAAMFAKTAEIREWNGRRGHYLYDQAFSTWFSDRMKSEPSFYTKSVFIPIPWHRIVEQGPKGILWTIRANMNVKCRFSNFATKKSDGCWGLQKAYDVLTSLDPGFKYFTVMSQSHVGQVIEFGGSRFGRVQWENILVFDSRGRDASTSQYARIPIPLLREKDDIQQNAGPMQKQKKVFFAGQCDEDDGREAMGPGKPVPPGRLPNGTYEWEIHNCYQNKSQGLPYETFRSKLQQSTWTIAPAGTMPTSFIMYEALQAGSLTILPWQNHTHRLYKPELSRFIWLPYRDIGVQWQHGVAELLEATQLESLKGMIESITDEEVARRQRLLQHVQPLFFQEGLHEYIIYMIRTVNRARSVMEEIEQEETPLARAVDLIQWQTL